MKLEEAVRRVYEATYATRKTGIPIDAFTVVFSPEDFYDLKAEAFKVQWREPPLEHRFGGLPVKVDRTLEPGDIVLRAEVTA